MTTAKRDGDYYVLNGSKVKRRVNGTTRKVSSLKTGFYFWWWFERHVSIQNCKIEITDSLSFFRYVVMVRTGGPGIWPKGQVEGVLSSAFQVQRVSRVSLSRKTHPV
jgi:hypothetical protein